MRCRSAGQVVDEAQPSDRKKVVILGGGPNRIGQGIEFDYCCCHAAFALTDAGYETIMVNCNPETVSTDYDTSDRLYFEPLTEEDVIEILTTEKQNGTLHGVIVQFGGQTPLNLAEAVETAGVPILGTQPDAIDLAEDRDRFMKLISKLGLTQPKNGIAYSLEQARLVAERLGFPLVIRPSYVLGGRAMAIVQSADQFESYIQSTLTELVPPEIRHRYPNDKTGQINSVLSDNPLLFDAYLTDAMEIDVDCLCDGKDVFVCGIMEHIEEAGIHSGDSACSLPPHTLSDDVITELKRQTRELALALKVGGLMNVQFALKDGTIYILEVNPRASRTVPFVAKVIGVPIAKIASRIMAGETLASFKLAAKKLNHIGIKEAVFPFARFPGVDTVLGPEMKSTGEVIGLDTDYAIAFAKSQLGAGAKVPKEGTVFVSVRDDDKEWIVARDQEVVRCRIQDHRHGWHAALSGRAGRAGDQDQQGAGRPAAHRRCDEEWRRAIGDQYHRGHQGCFRQPRYPPHRASGQDSLLHDHPRRHRRRGRHHRLSRGQSQRSAPAGLFCVRVSASVVPLAGRQAMPAPTQTTEKNSSCCRSQRHKQHATRTRDW